MMYFSIRELENFSGVKKHTIRIWEHRYHIFNPQRDDSNVRYYTLEEVELLLNLALLNKNKFRISQLSKLELPDLKQKIKALSDDENRQLHSVNQLIIYRYSADIEAFENVLDTAVLSWGIDITIHKVILLFLEKANLLSYDDTSSEVHFVVTALRKKLILGIEKIAPPATNNKTALLFLQKGEHYDLLLLYMTYVIKSLGFKTLYLGTNISIENLKIVTNSKNPDILFTYTPPKNHQKINTLIPYIKEYLPEATLVIVGAEDKKIQCKTDEHVKFIHYKEISLLLYKILADN